jgi:molecular chaperone GrpE
MDETRKRKKDRARRPDAEAPAETGDANGDAAAAAADDPDRTSAEQKKEDHVVPFRVVDKRHAHENGGDGADDAEESADEFPTVVGEFQRRAEAAEEKLREYIAAYKQERVELDAVRRRLRADAEGRAREAIGRSLGRFLEVVDNLDRALAHAAEDDPLRDGVQQTRDMLLAVLKEQGVEAVEPLGDAFDPQVAEAVMTRPVGDEEDGRVVEVLRTGYLFDDKVLRAVQVVVGKKQ